MDHDQELSARLERYEVTTVRPATRLRLVWSAPDVEVDDAPAPAGVALLDAYRITRVPHLAAG